MEFVTAKDACYKFCTSANNNHNPYQPTEKLWNPLQYKCGTVTEKYIRVLVEVQLRGRLGGISTTVFIHQAENWLSPFALCHLTTTTTTGDTAHCATWSTKKFHQRSGQLYLLHMLILHSTKLTMGAWSSVLVCGDAVLYVKSFNPPLNSLFDSDYSLSSASSFTLSLLPTCARRNSVHSAREIQFAVWKKSISLPSSPQIWQYLICVCFVFVRCLDYKLDGGW